MCKKRSLLNKSLIIGILLLSSSCGYRFAGSERITLSVPYVGGDYKGELTAALINQIAQSSNFEYQHEGGRWILNAKVLGIDDERIGFRYDRSGEEGKRRQNLEAVENRRRVSVEVAVVRASTGEFIMQPQVITTEIDYDYVDPNSFPDLTFVTPGGKIVPSVSFSLGQLDAIDAVKIEALRPLYRRMASQIVAALIAYEI